MHKEAMNYILPSIFLYFLYSFIPVFAFPKRSTETFIIHYLEDRRIIPVRIELNTDQQTEHVASIAGETLYDFNQGKVAYKDITSSQCFIADIEEESLKRDRRKLKNLQNGVVRGFYMPTFIIQEELTNNTDLLENFGILLTEFCNGSTISLVTKQKHRKRRDSPGDKGQFTHHSYGHYGHQSTNYAHYGHETHMTGTIDKDGQRVNHQQIRSENSEVNSTPKHGNGEQVFSDDSTMRVNNPQNQYQTQYRIPSYRQTRREGNNFGTGNSEQFTLQSAQESGYQLNLPLGLQAGNTYRGGIRSAGHYGIGGKQPQITTEYKKYPDSIHSTAYQSPDQSGMRQPLPSVSAVPGISYPLGLSEQTGLTSEFGVGQPPVPGIPYPSRLSSQTGLTPESGVRQQLPPGPTIPEIPYFSGISSQRGLTPESGVRQPLPPVHPVPEILYPSGISSQRGLTIEDKMKTKDRTVETAFPGYIDLDQSKMTQKLSGIPGTEIEQFSTVSQPRTSASTITGDKRTAAPGTLGTHMLDTRTESRTFPTRDRRYPGADYDFDDRKHVDQRILSSGQLIPSKFDNSILPSTPSYPGSRFSVPGAQISSFQPGISMPSIQTPGRTFQSAFGFPGQISPGMHESKTTDTKTISGISRSSSEIPNIHQGLTPHQQYIPSSLTPGKHYLQTSGGQYPAGYNINSDIQRSQMSISPTLGISTGYERGSASGPVVDQISPQRPSLIIPSVPHSAGLRSNETNGIRYPDGSYSQTHTGIREEHSRGDSYPRIPGIPSDSRLTSMARMRPGETQFSPTGIAPAPLQTIRDHQIPTILRPYKSALDSRYDSNIPSRGTASELSTSADRRIITGQTGFESSRIFGQNSASSQTQIHTGYEGTAAEASAAGNYRGLGSQTQVQGGYAGNGSFSAQAQSGFIGGVVQSQVQGSTQGGLSGSNAQVERVGSAQSQVQIGRQNRSASSTAQGTFTGGFTQVQVQSSKTGGSAGAQAQSTGLSNSHVQVKIGGKDVSEKERFQGTVSASAQGGLSSGQSQAQLQGGYNSGRTYVATAQGGFDSSLGYPASIPPTGSLTNLSNWTFGGQQPFSAISSQETLDAIGGRQHTVSGSPNFGMPTDSRTTRDQVAERDSHIYSSRRLPDRTFQTDRSLQHQISSLQKTPHQALISPDSQTEETRTRYPSSILQTHRPSHLLPSSQSSQPAFRHPYPGYQTDISSTIDEKLRLTDHDIPVYKRYDERGLLPSGISHKPSQIGVSRIPGQIDDGIIQPAAFLPGTFTTGFQPRTQDSSLHTPALKPASSQGLGPSSVDVPSIPHSLEQQYAAGIPVRNRPLTSHLMPHSIHGLPEHQMTGLRPILQPGLKTEHYLPTSRFPDQSQISLPTSQMIPSHRQPDEMPVLTRPDSSHNIDFKPGLRQPPSLPDQSLIQSGQPQISQRPSIRLHQSQMVLPRPKQPYTSPPKPQVRTEQPKISPSRPQIRTEQPYILPSRPTIRPEQPISHTRLEQPQIRTEQTHISPSTEIVPASIPIPSETKDRKQERLPGVSEPDKRDCCDALRDLKRRCCGTSKQEGDSSCCGSRTGDIFYFSTKEDLDENKEPCKVVKAICYIVYKPVGKARVCKPTATTGC